MTFARSFVSWPTSGVPLRQYSKCSPNLLEVLHAVRGRWPVTKSLGCYGVRRVRGGSTESTHSWGAAIDISMAGLDRSVVTDDVLPWLVGWSDELGVQAVHDYIGCRIWRAGRTPNEADACTTWWRAQRPDSSGMGSNWATHLHIETTPTRWGDGRSMAERGVS